MSNFFKNKGNLMGLLMACILAITALSIFFSQNYLGNDFLKKSVEQETEASVADEPELVVDEVEINFSRPDSMRGVFLTKGKEFLTSAEDDTETVTEQVQKALSAAEEYTINTIIIDLRSTGDTDGVATIADSALLNIIVTEARNRKFYVYSVFDLSSYKHEMEIVGISTSMDESYSSLEDLEQRLTEAEIDGILLDGYQNEIEDDSYGHYAKLGGAIGFNNYMRQNSEQIIVNVKNTVRKTSPNTQVGLLADPVWANIEENPEGSETQSNYTSLLSANADTKSFIEDKIVDFVVVKALSSTTNETIPFEQVINWWGDLAKKNSMPTYIMQASSLVGSGEKGWGAGQLLEQAELVDSVDGLQGNAFDSLAKLMENTAITESLVKYYNEDKRSGEEKDDSEANTKTEESKAPIEKEPSSESSRPITESKPPVGTTPAEQGVAISLSQKSLILKVKESGQLKAAVTPVSADQTVNWSSEDKNTATVDANGKVTAVKKGVVIVTAKSTTGKIANCTVTVTEAGGGNAAVVNVAVDDIVISKEMASVGVKATVQLDVGVYPTDATDKTINWSSNDSSIVTVDSKGVITGIAKGSAKISATSADGRISATCTINVTDETSGPSAPTGEASSALKEATYIEVFSSDNSMYVGTTQTLSVQNQNEKVIPNSQLYWQSSDKSIATVDTNGVVTAKRKAGVADIYVYNKEETLVDYFLITVTTEKVKVTSIKLNQDTLSVAVGKTNKSLTAKIEPSGTSTNNLEWRIVNSKIASVDSKGVVRGIARGNTTLIVKAKNSNVQATCRIDVTAGIVVEDIYLDDNFEMIVGEEDTLVATIYPTGAELDLTWTSSNPSTLSVDAKGNIVAKRAGTATITVKVVGKEEYYDTCTIKVAK